MKKSTIVAVMASALSVVLSPGAAIVSATWAQVPSPNSPGSNEILGLAAASTSQVWAVGRVVDPASSQSYRSIILRHNGSSWAAVPHPGFGRNHMLQGVDAISPSEAWAVGIRQTEAGPWQTHLRDRGGDGTRLPRSGRQHLAQPRLGRGLGQHESLRRHSCRDNPAVERNQLELGAAPAAVSG